VKALRRLHHLARADFYERVRRHGFLVALLFCVYAGYAFLPPNHSNYVTLVMGHHRGIYNSAWVGTAVAMLSGSFISLIGFFIVKNAVERDRRTGVGQILATTPISRIQYTVGKRSAICRACLHDRNVALACVVMPSSPKTRAQSWQCSPVRPVDAALLMMTSAVAVFFETMPIARRQGTWPSYSCGVHAERNLTRSGAVQRSLGSGIALPACSVRRAASGFDPAAGS
jgi:hypothetical protein